MADETKPCERCQCGAVQMDRFIGTYTTLDMTHTRERCVVDGQGTKPCGECDGSGYIGSVHPVNDGGDWEWINTPCPACHGIWKELDAKND